jgi:hypothetical protein
MENPATWGKAEKVIDQAHKDYWKARKDGVIGWSLIHTIAEALREAGLLRDEDQGELF